VAQSDPNGGVLSEIPFGKLRSGSRPAGENAGLRNDTKRIRSLGDDQSIPRTVAVGSPAFAHTLDEQPREEYSRYE